MTNAELIKNLLAVFIAILNYLGSNVQTPLQTPRIPADSPKLFRIIRLIQSTSESTWGLIRNTSILVCIAILGYDVALVVGLFGAVVIEGHKELLNGGIIVIAIVLFVFPILSLRDDYKAELRLRRGERSRVFKWAEIEIVADYDSLLIRCLQVLSDMGARITHYNAVIGAVVAELPHNTITIEIRQLQDNRFQVYIASDSKLPTVRIDRGINQKYVNECATRLLGYR